MTDEEEDEMLEGMSASEIETLGLSLEGRRARRRSALALARPHPRCLTSSAPVPRKCRQGGSVRYRAGLGPVVAVSCPR